MGSGFVGCMWVCWPSSSGINFRKYHSFSSEDWIGKVKTCCAASQPTSLEEFSLKRWYTGLLGQFGYKKLCVQ